MKRKHSDRSREESSHQLTVRGVPAQVKKILSSRARTEKKSLNTVLVEALSLAAGVSSEAVYDDLDHLAGLWEGDPEFDKAVEEQRKIDDSMWQ